MPRKCIGFGALARRKSGLGRFQPRIYYTISNTVAGSAFMIANLWVTRAWKAAERKTVDQKDT